MVSQYHNMLVHHPASGLQPWLRHIPTQRPLNGLLGTRHLFETTARRLVTEDNDKDSSAPGHRVKFVYGVTVEGLLFDSQDEGRQGAAASDAGAASGRPHDARVTGV